MDGPTIESDEQRQKHRDGLAMLRSVQERSPGVPFVLPERPPAEGNLQKAFERAADFSDEREKAKAAERERLRRRGLVSQLAKDLGRRDGPELATLDRFEAWRQEVESVKNRVQGLITSLPAMTERGEGIIWFGSVGSGKDHLQAALLYEAARQGISCRRFVGSDFFGRLRDGMIEETKEAAVIMEFTKPQIVAISDPAPPSGVLTSFRIEFLWRLINQRYEAKRPTWMTLNATGISEIEDILSSQTWDRLQDQAELIECSWPSYRERNREQRTATRKPAVERTPVLTAAAAGV